MGSPTDPRSPLGTIEVDDAVDSRVGRLPDGGEAAPISTAGNGRTPNASNDRAVGIQVFRDLRRTENRPNRIRRVLRIWESKVSTAIRSRDLRAAEDWVHGLTGYVDIPPEHAEAVGAALVALSRPALIDDLVIWLVDTDAIDEAAGLFTGWGDPIVGRMIDLMGVDDPPIDRHYMVEVLTLIGRSDSRLLTPHLSDSRWFIVRNVAIALGKSGRPAIIPALRSLLAHEDARVRVEALRGLAYIDCEATVADLVGGYRDSDRRVRQVAISLLRACPSPDVVTRLSAVIATGKLNTAEAERLIEVIGERSDDAARQALEQISSRRGRAGVAKAVREAAKRQLARRAS